MSAPKKNKEVCIIIGASHAGVNCAFALRKEGWTGVIKLFDADPELPYHRPPLSKAYLGSKDSMEKNILKSAESYAQQNIHLHLGTTVKAIDARGKSILLENDDFVSYDKLVLATGARAFIPSIPGVDSADHLFTLRTANDADQIRKAFHQLPNKRVLLIGGGYIGLETAASLKKLGAEITVLEREERILARVTAPELSDFFQQLHRQNGVQIRTGKNVTRIEKRASGNEVFCEDQTSYPADLIIIGVGVRVNSSLAESADLKIENGISVNAQTQTSNKDIYAIGDCSYHYHPHYDRMLRLESVQNAVDQAKVAASVICGKEVSYDSIPWFWSDQYDVKLQMVGLSEGYTELLIRAENEKPKCLSFWYFKEEELLAVDAINNARAYILGTKLIKTGQKIDKQKLVNPVIQLKPNTLIV